jgi:diacylglycerol kinase (ATP)
MLPYVKAFWQSIRVFVWVAEVRKKGGQSSLKTAFIVNSVAVGRCDGRWGRIEEGIRNNGHSDVDVRATDSFGQATYLARDAVKSGCRVVVAVGGDGTVNEVLNGMFENGLPLDSDLVLGIVPLGSGCDLARTLGVTVDTTPALKALDSNSIRRLDVGKVEFVNLRGEKETRLFINIADLGAGGLVVEKASRAPRILGPRPNYFWGILTAAVFYRARKVSISVDGGSPMGMAVRNTIIANGRYFGRGFLAAPEARMDDGLFDIINVGDFGTLEGLRHVPKLRNGKHLGLQKVNHSRGRIVHVTSDEDVLLEMDGDLVGTLPASFEIIPGAIGVMVN